MSESTNSKGRVIVGVDRSTGSVAGLNFAFNEAKRRGTNQPVTTRSSPATDLGAMSVNAVMSRNVLVVDANDPVLEVWHRMQDLGGPLAVVRDGTQIVAVVSQRALALGWPSGGPLEMRRRRVRHVIDPGTPIVRPHTTVRKAAELINVFKVEGVPVVAAVGALLGLVTPTELIRLLADATPMAQSSYQG